MLRERNTLLLLAVLCLPLGTITAQSQPAEPASTVTTKSVQAIGYTVGGGDTKVDLNGTSLMPQANGEAKVEAKAGATKIDVSIKGLAQPSTLGTEFMTYVLWAVSPD